MEFDKGTVNGVIFIVAALATAVHFLLQKLRGSKVLSEGEELFPETSEHLVHERAGSRGEDQEEPEEERVPAVAATGSVIPKPQAIEPAAPPPRGAAPGGRRPEARIFGNRALSPGAKLVLASEIMRRPTPFHRAHPAGPVS
jgi:hypothetical protein